MDIHHSAAVLVPTDLKRQPNNLHRALAREAWFDHPTVTIEYDADSDRLVVRFLSCPTAAKVRSDEPLFIGFDGCDEQAWPTILTHLAPSALTAADPSPGARQMLYVLGGTAAARVVTILQGRRSTHETLVLTHAEAAASVASWSELTAQPHAPAGGQVTDAELADALSRWADPSGLETVVTMWTLELDASSRLAVTLRGADLELGENAQEPDESEAFSLSEQISAQLRGRSRKEHERLPKLQVQTLSDPRRLRARLTVSGGLDDAVSAITIIASTGSHEARISLDLADRDDVSFTGEAPWPDTEPAQTTARVRLEVTRRA